MPKLNFPPFNEARGETASMQLIPPFHFTGVTMRVFPLRANRYLLQRFIDQQLNIIPPEAGDFRVFLPYIYLIIVNYGKMSVEAANLGWISQNEVAFSVPLIWRREVDGRMVQDFAYVSPFIYVDNQLSMTTGREVYGWPKMMASFDPQLSSWMANPTNRIQQAAMSVDMVREAYSGGRSTRCTLMEVDSAPIPTFAQVPFDVRNPVMPWNAMRKAIYTGAALMGDSVELFRGMLEEFVFGSGRLGLAGQVQRAMQSPASLGVLNTVNLKQFRDAEQPKLVAYQAVTNTPMTVKSFRRGGMLGDLRALTGDVTGGYRIRIHNYDTQPIIGTLGLEVASTAEIEGTNVSNLLPIYPFWMEVDLEYPLASILAWRHRGGHCWYYGDSAKQIAADSSFNTARGAGNQEIAGPFQAPDATVRVLPLQADPEKLTAFIDAYLNATLAETSSRFEVWGRYVYAVVLSDDAMFSESNNVGEIATRQLGVYIPVKWYEQTADGKQLISTGLVPVYSYANSATAAISTSSVAGVPTMTAKLQSPPSTWLEPRGPSPVASDELLVLRGEVLPVLNLGQQATERTIMQCDTREPIAWEDVQGWRRLADRWAPPLKREHQRKRDADPERLRDAKTLALELLANHTNFQVLTLKQFRSAEAPNRACYQALVSVPSCIEQLHELEEIHGPMHLRIHEYPSQAIVSTLGLVVKDWQHGGGSLIAVVEPCRPFWFRARMRQHLGTNVHVWTLTPAGTPTWTPAPAPHGLLTDGPRLGPSLVDDIDDGIPQYLSGQATRWLDEGEDEPLSVERARAAVESVEPQIVIESVLSCEWEAWLDPRWARGRARILERLEKATAGAFPSEITKKAGEVLSHTCEQLRGERRVFGMTPARHRDVSADLEWYHELGQHLAEVQASEEQLRAVEAKQSKGTSKDALSRRKAADDQLVHHLKKRRRREQPAHDVEPGEQQASPLPSLPEEPSELFERVFEMLDEVIDEHVHEPSAVMSDEARETIVALVRSSLDDLRTQIVLKLAKSWQKPDACIRRRTVLHENVDVFFPIDECFDEDWYTGEREPTEPPGSVADRVADIQLIGVTPGHELCLHSAGAEPFWSVLPGTGAITALTCTRDGVIIGVGMDQALWTRKLSEGWAQVPHSQAVMDVTLLPDGRIVGIGMNFELYLRAALHGAPWEHIPSSGAVQALTALPDGRIAAADRNGRLHVRSKIDAPWELVDDTHAITRLCALSNGWLLGVGPNQGLYVREDIYGRWMSIAGAEGVIAVARPIE